MTSSRSVSPVATSFYDRLGIGVSGLCVLHCLATPLLVALAPGLFWFENEWIHLGFATMAAGFLLLAMRQWRRDRTGIIVRLLGVTAVAGLFGAALADIAEAMEQAATIASALLLSISHIIGSRCRH
ncbi:MerC domain-containing protein [Hyphobacterium sp.]|uniref:MerC domain-containing protein n=1 Tax=Hyphobacterium sp. TaxID=2004662 RepID=UPI003748912C